MHSVAGPDQGLSLVGVLVAVAILGILATAATRVTTSSLKSIKRISLVREQEDLKNLIRLRTDCAETKKHISNGSQNIILYDKKGNAVMPIKSGEGMQQGKWTIVVKGYNNANGEFQINASKGAYTTTGNLFKPVPFTCG